MESRERLVFFWRNEKFVNGFGDGEGYSIIVN